MPDTAAFEGFYRDNLTRIVRACYLVLLDRASAEDVAAEAFARLWSRWGAIHGTHHAGGFVFKTAMRLCRRRARRVAPIRTTDPPDPIASADVRRDLIAALASLPVRQRECIVLRDWADYDTREVARILRMRESTVRVHLTRARQTLRSTLSVEDPR